MAGAVGVFKHTCSVAWLMKISGAKGISYKAEQYWDIMLQ